MRTRARRDAAGPIGVDLGARCVKLAQLQRDPDGEQRIACEVRRLPADLGPDPSVAPDAVAALVRDALRSGGFVGRKAVGCVPESILEYRIIRLAAKATGSHETKVHEQFATQLDLPENGYRSQFFDAGKVWEDDEHKQEILAMAAPISALDEYLDLLLRCELEPVAVDARPAALVRVLTSDDEDGCGLLVDIGYRFTTLTVASSAGIRFIRRLGSGLAAIDDAVIEKTEASRKQAEQWREASGVAAAVENGVEPPITDEVQQALGVARRTLGTTLTREISKCLQYYGVTFREPRPAWGIAVGGGAQDEQLLRTLAENTGVEMRTAEDLLGAGTAAPVDGASPGLWATAMGLSMYLQTDAAKRAAA